MNSVFAHLFLVWRFGISGLLFEQIRSMGKKVLVFLFLFSFLRCNFVNVFRRIE